MKKLLFLICMLTASISRAELTPLNAPEAVWEVNPAINYDTGKYGSNVRTESVYMPLTFRHYYPNAGLSVTVPYLRQSSTGQVTRVGGRPVRAASGSGAEATSGSSGLGDIMLRGTYTLKLEGLSSFDLALAGKLKLPTASKKKGLGTGELDEGVGLEFAKELAPRWTLLADGYYTIIGDPYGVNFNNEVSLDIGFYRPLNKNLSLTVFYETQSALVDGNAAPRTVSGTLSYRAPGGGQLAGGLTLGLSDGSPDVGIGAGYNRKF